MAERKLNYEIDVSLNKNSINSIMQELSKVEKQMKEALRSDSGNEQLKETLKTAQDLKKVFGDSWNVKLNQLDWTKFNDGITKSWGSVEKLKKSLQTNTSTGVQAFNSLSQSVLNTNLQLSKSNEWLDKMAKTLANTVRWTISSKAINTITGSVEKAFNYTVKLDKSLNDIRIVTGKSADEMNKFAIQANKAAKALGASTRDYTEASLIYYQQGLGDAESQRRAETTLKAANVTGQSAQEVSEQLTAVWMGYNTALSETELYVDKLAAVAAATAADLEQLSTGMSKVASAASVMGVDIDQLSAQLATIVSVTQQAPESVGTALRTIYARMGDIKSGLDEEITLGNYTSKMAELGVNVLDADNKLRDIGEVIEEVGNKWKDMSKEQQVALAQTMAGTRQYNNLLALFNSWDMYQDSLQTSLEAAGTLQEQQDIYLESTEAHLQKLRTEAEKTYDVLFDTDTVNGFTDALTGTLSVFNTFLQGLGGGNNDFIYFGALLSKIFSKQIAGGIQQAIDKFNTFKNNVAKITSGKSFAEAGYSTEFGQGENVPGYVKQDYEYAKRLYGIQSELTNDQMNELDNLRQKIFIQERILEEAKEEEGITQKLLNQEEDRLSDLEELENKFKEINILSTQGEKIEGNRTILLNESLNILKETADVEEIRVQWEKALSENDEKSLSRLEGKIRNLVKKEINQQKTIIEEIENESLGNTIDEASEKLNKSKDEFNEKVGKIEAEKSIRNVIDAISSLTQVITILDGAWKNFTSNEMTFEESLGALITTLPALIIGFVSLDSAVRGMSVSLGLLSNAEAEAGMAAWASLGPYALLAVAIGAVVATIGVFTARAIYAADKQRVLNDELKEGKEAVRQANEEYEALKETVSSYTSAREGIDSLTEGTVEFYSAIQKSNEEAEKLIENMNLISGRDYTIDKNGLITITEDALKRGQFRQQQVGYRKSADVNATQLELEKLNINNIAKQFANEINKSDKAKSLGANLSSSQAKDILEAAYTGEDSKLTLSLGQIKTDVNNSFKDIRGKFNQVEENTTSIKDSTIDIGSQVRSNLPKYAEARARENQLKLQQSSNLIRGYGSQAQVEQYNKMSTAQQQSVNQYVANIRDKSTNKLSTKDYDFWDYAGNIVRNSLMGPLSIAGGTESIYSYQKNEANKKKVKEAYAQNALGYTKDGNQWYDENGMPISYKDAMKDISTKEAVQAYNSGAFSTQNSLQKMLELNTKTRNTAAGFGMNQSSQGYIAEAYSALVAGNKQYDFGMLSNEERQALSKMLPQGSTKEEGSKYLGLSESFSQEEIQKILTLTEQVGNSLARVRQDTANYNSELEAQANQLDTTKEALDIYAVALDKANGVEHEQTMESAQNAAERYKFNKAYNDSVKIYYDNEDAIKDFTKAIEKGEEPSYDLADAMGELSNSLKEMGLYLSGKSVVNNLDLINKLMTGTTEEAEEAYKALYEISQQDILKNLFGDPDDINLAENEANRLRETYDGIINAINETPIGESMAQDWADNLGQMINDLHLTADQIQELGSQLGIEIPVKYNVPKDFGVKNVKFTTEAQSVTHRYTGQMPNPHFGTGGDKKKTIKVDYAWVETTEAKTDSFTIPEGTNFRVTQNTQSVSGRNFSLSTANRNAREKSASSNEPDKMDPLEQEKDRYHDVDIQLKLIQNDLDKLDKQKDKLFGKDLLDNLNKQLALLDKQIDATNRKINIAQGEAQELRGKLAGSGVAFNADGTIANYEQAYQAQLNYVNSLINQYNSMSKEGQEGFKDTVEQAKENFNKFVSNIDRYDEVITDLIPGLAADVQEAIDKQIEIKIEEFDMEIEIRLDLAEAERDWNNFKKKIIDGIKDDDIIGNAMARLVDFSTYYDANNNGAVQSLSRQINNTLNELYQMDATGRSNIYGNNRNKALEDLKKYYDELMSQMQDVLSLQEEINNAYLDMLDEAQEKFDEQIDSYEMIGNLIEHDMKLVSLIYGDEAYHKLSNFYEQQQENYNAQLDFQGKQVAFWKEQMDAAEAGSEAWDKAREKWAAATENLNSLIEKSIENLRNKYSNAIKGIFQDLNNEVTDGKGLEYVEEEWNLINKNADQYLDTINTMYSIQSLENKYLDAINNNSNLNTQKQLKKIMEEELGALRERDRLTEYDIERANKKYEITLKQFALEEAQQNKNQLRLRRDSQGNYRYEFVNDDEQVKQLQNDLDDLYNSLYNFDKENYADNLNQLYDVWNEYQEKMAEAAMINDPEQRAERELLIQQQYGDLINSLTEQNTTIRGNLYDSAFEDLARLYDEDKTKFENMTQEEQDALMTELIPNWDKGIQHMADTIIGEGGFYPTTEEAFEKMNDATMLYEDELNKVGDLANVNFDKLNSGLDPAVEKTQSLQTATDELFKTYKDNVKTIGDVVKEMDNLVKKYDAAKKSADEATAAAHNYWSEQQRQAAEEAAKNQAKQAAAAAQRAAQQAQAVQAQPSGGSGGGDGVPRVGDIVTYVSGRYHADSYGGGASGAVGLNGQVQITRVKEDGRPYPIHIATLAGGPLGWLSRGQISGYDTGGYTGEWGNTGRLALLHQKELVLNKEDTSNLLNAVSIMRAITDNISSKVLSKLALASSNNNFNSGALSDGLNQNVYIDAQFPNVKESREIEEALNNLVNAAAQRVGER